jgi:2-methylcitrate dehydratase PrpD
VTPGALALCWRKLPDTELEAQVSLYHWLAATLVCGEATVTQAQLACIQDPRVRDLQSRLDATSAPALAIDQAKATMRRASCSMRRGTCAGWQTSRSCSRWARPERGRKQ